MPPHGAPAQHTSGSDSKQAFSAQELRHRSERDRHRSERDQRTGRGEHLFDLEMYGHSRRTPVRPRRPCGQPVDNPVGNPVENALDAAPQPPPTPQPDSPPTTLGHSPERHTGERHSHPHTPPLGVLDKFSPTPKLTPRTTKAPRPPEGRRGANARGSASTSQPPDHHRQHPQNTEGRDVGQSVGDEERPITTHDGRARRPRRGRGRSRPT